MLTSLGFLVTIVCLFFLLKVKIKEEWLPAFICALLLSVLVLSLHKAFLSGQSFAGQFILSATLSAGISLGAIFLFYRLLDFLKGRETFLKNVFFYISSLGVLLPSSWAFEWLISNGNGAESGWGLVIIMVAIYPLLIIGGLLFICFYLSWLGQRSSSKGASDIFTLNNTRFLLGAFLLMEGIIRL